MSLQCTPRGVPAQRRGRTRTGRSPWGAGRMVRGTAGHIGPVPRLTALIYGRAMDRSPKAAGRQVVRRSPLALALLLIGALMLLSSAVAARGPGDSGAWLDVPWSDDAAELARTAKQAVSNGTTSASCTGWRSTYVPPPSIRVLRTLGPAAGTVQEVPFRSYVETVFGAEWQGFYHIEALKAGAIAVKQYGWYYTIVYRGGESAAGECYDVEDDTTDQYYQPELRTPVEKHFRALDATWGVTLRKYQPSKGTSRFFLTGYRQGSTNVCGTDADRFHLYQHSALACAKAGMRFESILRVYLEPNLEIVEPGAHDVVGEERGDAAALVEGDGLVTARVHSPVSGTGFAPAAGTAAAFDADGLVAARSADLTGDGRDDLLLLYAPPGEGWRLDVAASDGVAGYGETQTWLDQPGAALSDDASLLAGDFHADGLPDAAILSPQGEPGLSVLRVYRGSGSGFETPVDWWTGELDTSSARAWAVDATGDGRADLVVARDLGDGGLEYLVAASQSAGASLGPLVSWAVVPELRWATTRHAAADFDRDGRDDLWVVTPSGSGTSVSVLRARPASFILKPRWESPSVPFEGLKLGAADINYDGRGDLVLYLDLGASGTRLQTLRNTYQKMVPVTPYDDASLDWSATDPF